MQQMIFAAAVMMLGITSAAAQSANANNSASQSGASVVVSNPGRVVSRIKTTPSAIAPGLTASAVETCLGSASAGGSGMGWGGAIGFTIKDRACEARLDAKMLATLGQGKAAVLRLCNRPAMAKALQASGVDCNAYNSVSMRQIVEASATQPVRTTKIKRAAAPSNTPRYNPIERRWE